MTIYKRFFSRNSPVKSPKTLETTPSVKDAGQEKAETTTDSEKLIGMMGDRQIADSVYSKGSILTE